LASGVPDASCAGDGYNVVSGSFSISAHAGLPETLRVGVFGQLSPEGASGSLLGDVVVERKRDGNATSVQGTVLTLAHWDEASVAPEVQ
jgi:hypothetical protein